MRTKHDIEKMESDSSIEEQPDSLFSNLPAQSPDASVKKANNRYMYRIFSRDPVLWFMFASFAIVAYVFYNTEFRDVLEEWFFDVRMKWAPEVNESNDIVVLAIDEPAIETLDVTQMRVSYDGKKRPFLSIDAVTRVAGLLANSEALSISLLLPNHAFPHTDERLNELVEIVKFDQRMLVGTTEYNRTVPSVTQIPYPLGTIRDRVFGYETFRKRSNVLVRELRYMGYRGLSEELMLPVKVASIVKGSYGEINEKYTLNHVHPSKFKTISAKLADSNPRQLLEEVKGKVVILGYTVNREIPFQTTDMMLVNTPLIGNEQTAEKGMSTTYLVANAIENLIHDRNIKELDPAFNFLQTIIVATLIGLLWEFGSFTASTLTVILWLVLLFAHALSFHFLNRSIPLADTFFASALVSIFAAVRRLKGELKDMAAKQAKADAKNEVARIQSLFLTDFASWLKTVTQLIVGQVRATQPLITASNPRASDLYRRAFSAGEEFNDYLESIRQIPELENLSHRAKKTRFDVRDFVQKITRRFEIKAQEKSIVIEIDIGENASYIVANASLLDSIVFNFISNAVKYSPNDSRIVIRGVRNSNREYVLSVIDSGPGIPDNLRDRIFEKFYRIQDERIYNSKGSGLGLYLSKYFAEGMGGRVDVISSPSGGSEFRVILP